MSKKHKGMSDSYNKKMKTRKLNTLKREMRKKAKAKIQQVIGTPLHKNLRSFITMMTKLYEERENASSQHRLDDLAKKENLLLIRIQKS